MMRQRRVSGGSDGAHPRVLVLGPRGVAVGVVPAEGRKVRHCRGGGRQWKHDRKAAPFAPEGVGDPVVLVASAVDVMVDRHLPPLASACCGCAIGTAAEAFLCGRRENGC